jgi:hypothetical protein
MRVFEVKATAGDTHLVGEGFESRLVKYCAADFLKRKGIDIRKNARAIRLRTGSGFPGGQGGGHPAGGANPKVDEVDGLHPACVLFEIPLQSI